MKNVFGWVGLIGLGISGCSPTVASGIRAYHAGACATALEHFLDGEQHHRASCSSDRLGGSSESNSCVRYALYRGLVHLSLDDKESSEYWLALAKTWLDEQPGGLDSTERGRLIAGWTALGHAPGTWGKTVREQR